MAALTAPFLNTKIEPAQVIPNLFPDGLGLAAGAKLYANAIGCKNASGYAVPASADPALVVLGRNLKLADNSSGSAGDIKCFVEQGAFDYDIATGANAVTVADIGSIVFAQDDHTISKSDQAGTLPKAGVLLNVFTPPNSSSARAVVQLGLSLAGHSATGSATTAFFARCVMTAMGAYAAASGVLTASANAALGTQDGVTLAVGDVVIVPAVVTGGATIGTGDAGPYVVTSLGSASAKYALTRPAWWAHGAAIPIGRSISLSGEGTKWSGIAWRSLAAKGAIVGTTDAKLYPQIDKGAGAVGTGITTGFFWTAAQVSAMDTTAAHFVQPALAAGNGTGTLSFTGTGTDAISYAVFNF